MGDKFPPTQFLHQVPLEVSRLVTKNDFGTIPCIEIKTQDAKVWALLYNPIAVFDPTNGPQSVLWDQNSIFYSLMSPPPPQKKLFNTHFLFINRVPII